MQNAEQWSNLFHDMFDRYETVCDQLTKMSTKLSATKLKRNSIGKISRQSHIQTQTENAGWPKSTQTQTEVQKSHIQTQTENSGWPKSTQTENGVQMLHIETQTQSRLSSANDVKGNFKRMYSHSPCKKWNSK